MLERSGLLDKIGQENCFETTDAAICALSPELGCHQELISVREDQTTKLPLV
ncbi:hypothetical protein IQ230_13095 [Gloeocapsopsis crepidinum LEGE 06123]|uniref:Uncharacterized protein n=1 Tax=Gloeocapsopsis crepidinum LEGE 06123 TaxID=588587 RepID=A0ABR9USK6_9CHRO|nr:hypothetical protein [Gloeocapsopsis crepidinum]MBE9191272.1 hypothetical protein [Gloeocapsopsis crepidinum LEGE 06123]